MKHILIVGKRFSGLVNKIEALGHEYTLLQDVIATKFPDKKFKRRVVADFSTTEGPVEAAQSIHQSHPIDAVMTIYENYVLPTAHIGQALGVPHLPVGAAEACTDKFLMRSLFANAPEKISPDFAVVHSEDDVRNFASSHSFPLILKPANLAKSLLVTKNNSLDELLASYKKSCELLESIYKKYAPNRTPTLIIEEFLEGSVHSVDAFIDADGIPHVLEQVVDYQTGYDIGYDDNFHYSRLMPSKLSAENQAALRHCADIGARALGMKSSPAHIEVIMTSDGPRIVEIGARNGGYRERMHELGNDLDLIGLSVQVALDQPVHVTTSKNDPVAVLELFPKSPGEFVELANEETLRTLPSLRYLSIKPTSGSFVGKSSDGYKACAVIILHNSDEGQFNRDLDYINASVVVTTR